MATINVPNTTGTDGINLADDNDVYIVDVGITVSPTADDAFFGGTAFTGNEFQISGTVGAVGTKSAFHIFGNHTRIAISTTGVVTAENAAIWLQGNQSEVINRGSIDSSSIAVKIENTGGFVKNLNSITADGTGIVVIGTGGEVENYDTIDAVVGVKSSSSTGDDFSLFNKGTITGSQYSFSGSAATDTVINQGSLVGDVILLNGNDKFIGTGGTVTGDVFGGAGNDTFTVDSGALKPIELAGEGKDTVISSANYTLRVNLENLELSGSANINGTGNRAANSLLGNVGANKLSGGIGNDHLAGGRGNDTLTGGPGKDVFVFANGMGKDVITDFVATTSSHDVIDLSAVSAITSFADLQANHFQQVGSDVIIKINNTNRITIEDVSLSKLDAGDFLF